MSSRLLGPKVEWTHYETYSAIKVTYGNRRPYHHVGQPAYLRRLVKQRYSQPRRFWDDERRLSDEELAAARAARAERARRAEEWEQKNGEASEQG